MIDNTLNKKTIKLDLSRKLKGRGLEATFLLLNKDGKLSDYEIARGKAIDKATGGDGKLADESEETKTEKAPDLLSKQKKKLDSFEKYKLSQAKRYLKNIKTFNKIMSHMSGINEKDARKCIKKYS
jgi:hypothetical protein